MIDKKRLLKFLICRYKEYFSYKRTEALNGQIFELALIKEYIERGDFDIKPEACKWKKEDIHYYESSCGQEHLFGEFVDDEVEIRGFKFCPFCGKSIEEAKE